MMKASSVPASAASPAAGGTLFTLEVPGPFGLLALALPAVVAFCGGGTKDIHLLSDGFVSSSGSCNFVSRVGESWSADRPKIPIFHRLAKPTRKKDMTKASTSRRSSTYPRGPSTP